MADISISSKQGWKTKKTVALFVWLVGKVKNGGCRICSMLSSSFCAHFCESGTSLFGKLSQARASKKGLVALEKQKQKTRPKKSEKKKKNNRNIDRDIYKLV